MKRKGNGYWLSRRPILMLLICCGLFLGNITAAAADDSAENRTVRAGVFFFDGYHMQDSDGEYTGYGIELLNLISQYSHLNFEFVGYDKSWAEMQVMLQNGEIDVVTSARKTKARKEIFAFSLPIERNNTVLSVLEDETRFVTEDYRTYDGMTIGLLTGSSQNESIVDFAAENGFTYRTKEYEDSNDLEAALRNGEIDAILTSTLRQAKDEKVLDTIKIDYFYAITRKEDKDILDEINYALGQMNIYEGEWANYLYNKYYGSESVIASGFTPREQAYIDAVLAGEQRITVTAMPNRKPYSYVEDGELKGILPQFFDRLMRIAGLPYEVIVPASPEEYNQLVQSGGVDVVIDWQQASSKEREYTGDGFLTNAYMDTGTTLLTRKDFSGPVSSLAVLDGLAGLPLDYAQFSNADIRIYPRQQDVLNAVLTGATDAAFMRTHTAEYFVNNDQTNSLKFSIIDYDQIVFNMYVPRSRDHELVTILNRCINQIPDDVLSRLITSYTAGKATNVSFSRYMAAHPGMIVILSGLVALALGLIIYLYIRSQWNNRLLRTAEESKQEVEEQLAIVKALSRDYLTVYKIDLRTGYVLPLKTEGYMPKEFDWQSGQPFPFEQALQGYIAERVFDEDREALAAALSLERLQDKLTAGSEYMGTYRILEGEEIHNFQFVCVAYQTANKAKTGVLLGFRNIDDIVSKEQKQKATLEEALHMAQAASEAKTSFLSNVSHDIRTPMNAIIGFLTLMRDEVENPETVREYIQRIDAASQHLLGLINDVLDMNKIESGSTTLNLAEINLAEIIAEINTIIQTQARAKNQTFEIFASHLNFEHLLGDKMRINQILINLLSNSVKYTQENGIIAMRVEELPQVMANYSRIRFTVSDNGMGMSEKYLQVIFEPFTREDTEAAHEIQGTGLGMAITKSLVELMGGIIKVDSRLGEGTTFVVELELPIKDQDNDVQFWSNNHIARMLVVDDDEEVCRNVVKAMAGVNVTVEYATDGERAVQLVEIAHYDLILLDWKMPGMSGLETARFIRQKVQTPILLLTSYDWREIEQEALASGVNHFMAKPFFMSTFKEAVRVMLGRAKEAKSQESDVVKGMHILVVDDIEVNQIILVKILGALGAECETAANGQMAVDKFLAASAGYDLILMDVQMPVLNGYEATKAIRASEHPLAKSIPIIAMTANAFVDDVRDAIDSGMDAHIAKPVQIDKLKSTIRQVLDKRKGA